MAVYLLVVQLSVYPTLRMRLRLTKINVHEYPPRFLPLHNPVKPLLLKSKAQPPPPTMAPGQVVQVPAQHPTAHHPVLHPLVQLPNPNPIINNNNNNNNNNYIEHRPTAAASPKCQYPSAPSSPHTPPPYPAPPNSTCKIRASHRAYDAPGGRCIFVKRMRRGVRSTRGFSSWGFLCSPFGGLRRL